MGRFPAQVTHWERTIGVELQLSRSQRGLSGFAPGRPLTQVQERAAVAYVDDLRKRAKVEANKVAVFAEENAAAQVSCAAAQKAHQRLVLEQAEVATLRSVCDMLCAVGEPEEVDEIETYLKLPLPSLAAVEKAAVDFSQAQHNADFCAWRVERCQVRLRVIENELTTVLVNAGIGE